MLSLCPFFWELIAKLGLLLLGHEEQEGVFGSAHFLVVQSKLSRRRICTCQKGGKHTQTHAHTIPSEPTHTLSYAHTHTHNAVRDGANQSCIGIIHTHTHTHARTHTHKHTHTQYRQSRREPIVYRHQCMSCTRSCEHPLETVSSATPSP